jgi:Holliday junction DNA helicase RuvA
VIAYLRGICQSVSTDHIVLDVHGVGYHIHMAARETTQHTVGSDVEVVIHTVVREDAFELYGFQSLGGRDLFRNLVSVSGVGPKGALALLSVLSSSEIARAIRGQDISTLTRAKGIGKRTAELLIVRLRDRLPAELLTDGQEPGSREPLEGDGDDAPDGVRDTLSALVNLGYRANIAQQAINSVLVDGASDDFASLLRSSLALLRRQVSAN